MAYTTKAPTGLQIERSGNDFTFSWKIRDKDYGKKQNFEYQKAKDGKWIKQLITVRQTSVTLTLNPENITQLSFRVQGQRSSYTVKVETGQTDKNGNPKTKNETVVPLMSAWKVKDAGWVPTKPTVPTVSYDRTSVNTGKFTVSHDADTDGTAIAKYVQYQTCVSTSDAKPPKDGWSSTVNINATVDVSREVPYTEQTETISSTGLVRWFRARCSGPGGVSNWVYAHHAYSRPSAPALKSASAKKITARSATNLTAQWKSTYSVLKPLDEEVLQYVIGIPTDNACSAPASGWSDAISVTPSGKKDIVTASVSDLTTTDQCMWVRVLARHDDTYESYSKTVRVIEEKLAKPGINATPNFSTGSVSITLTINTQCTVARHLIFYRNPKKPKTDIPIAILAPGVTSTTVSVPAIIGASKSCFGAYAFVGTYSGLIPNPIMTSAAAIDEDVAPVEPDAPTLEKGMDWSTVFVGFTWRWADATGIEISWSDSYLAWQSNVEPKSYTVTDRGVTLWVIQGLDPGKTWYFRVRYIGMIDGDEFRSAWSEISDINLATFPEQPKLTLGSGFVLPGDTVSASWDYVNEDESPQDAGQICFAAVTEHQISYGAVLVHTGIEQSASISYNWVRGHQYYLACRVRAETGRYSDWSVPVGLYVPQFPALSFSETPFSNGVMTSLGGAVAITMEADNTSGQYAVYIVRLGDYHVDRPDDGVYDGYDGETIWAVSGHYSGGSQTVSFAIDPDDLIGELDDGARYRLIATFTDDYGQTVTRQAAFRVNWAHKASIVRPAAVTDKRLMAVRIAPIKPSGYVAGDVFDIYRITADQPELIVKDGEYGTTYVDPYPAFGTMCGHRVVAKTATGSYITSDNGIAWYDLGLEDGDYLDCDDLIIDANGMQIRLSYNIELTNKWQKDFKRTSYLGGSVQGDWNPAVLRDLSAKTVIVKGQDTDELMDLRDLAAYAGPAHIRTPDGSSFSCDIQVTEDASYNGKSVKYNLTVKGIDPEEPDGLTLTEWRELHPVG